MSTEKKFYITTPIYYVNDKPHAGHAYTTIAADVLARWHRIQGKDVFFLTGTDEHGAKVAEAASVAGRKPKEFCDQIAGKFKQAWQNLNIDYDYFIRTTDPKHQKGVIDFLTRLKKEGYLYEKDYSGLYCVGCEKFITEKELVGGKCPDHGQVPEQVTEKNWFFKLKEFLPRVKKKISKGELKIEPESALGETMGLLKQDLDDFSVSRQRVDWGIKLPWDQKQSIYVWIDALLNYWTAVKEAGRGKYWPPDLHLIGKDILKFHAVFWPAMLLAAGEDLLPRQIFVHGYFTINGQKMSKTLGNVIDPNDLVKKYGADATRYLLLSQFPFGSDGDISLAKLTTTYNADLANGLGNLVARVINFQFPISNFQINPNFQFPNSKLRKYNDLMKELKLFEVVKFIREKIKECNNLIEKEKPWEIKERNKLEKIIDPILLKIITVAEMIRPFMPDTYNKIQRILKTGKKEILFPRVK